MPLLFLPFISGKIKRLYFVLHKNYFFMPEEINPESRPEITKEQIEEELRTDPRYQSYFEGFNRYSIDSFISSYAMHKKMWLDYGQNHIDHNARAETQWMEEAAKHLTYIQQKKLFDAQCLWRAELATYEGVEISIDFKRWERIIFHCPFLEPITEEEVEHYQQFLLSSNANPDSGLFFLQSWQDYDEIKEAYTTGNINRSVPDWYEFYNGRTGAGKYMLLPDLRGPKEDFYRTLVYEKNQKEREAQGPHPEYKPDNRPMLAFYDNNQLRHFVNTFEDARTRELFEGFEYSNRNFDDRIELEETVRFLLDADEPIPIERHHDFREALREAERQYRLRKIAEHLPLAYEEYLLNESLGLRSAPDEKEDFMQDIAQKWREMILEGRRLAGEPEDFDF